ncbi:isopropylmalate synthase [Clostridium sp. BL-8]|uniref:homocitrate synthase/isopropylmalate synthase family protein n=1 Tax=Clostridium sp. BL-8 TaxID=349938 RepID=UPI00098C87F9|nr:isopropylmalate synthase [Clostridium sp. BL-8]OOM79509.1 homocitrate synthase [Clostridium sp. BL-8]
MSKENVIIIDKTLVVLDLLYGEKIRKKIPLVIKFINLLHQIGSDFIEVPRGLYEDLNFVQEEIKFIISEELIEIQGEINGNYEESVESYYKHIDNLRIAGLDNIIFYDYNKIFIDIIKRFGNSVQMCIKNKYFCAIAMSLEWIRLGGEKIVTTFSGIGGYTSLESVLGSLEFLENMQPKGNYVLFPDILELFEEITDIKIEPNAPFIGKDIFNVESGIHVNGIVKNPSTYEPYDPGKIGRKRKIIIGKHSGISALEIKLKELHIEYNNKNLSNILEKIRIISTQNKRGLDDDEIKQLFKSCGNFK